MVISVTDVVLKSEGGDIIPTPIDLFDWESLNPKPRYVLFSSPTFSDYWNLADNAYHAPLEQDNRQNIGWLNGSFQYSYWNVPLVIRPINLT